jgi:crossover junction endodeoxyribonuclease RuvC
LILGIDVGISGAVALLDGNKLVEVHDMPTVSVTVGGKKKRRIDARALYEILQFEKLEHAFIEIVNARPNQGVSSMFAFGQASGIAEAIAWVMTPDVTGVRPQTWKKHFKLGNDKVSSRELASQLWPDQADRFKRVKDDGRAEAALIALWGQQCILPDKKLR